MSGVVDRILDAKIRELRDEGRPTMEAVVAVLERVFRDIVDDARIVCLQAGPTTWVRQDETMTERRLAKYYILTGSAEPETLGYPLLTIRQAYSQLMDSWITASSLITGSTEAEIMIGVSLMVANHLGCFSGFRYSMNAAIAAGGRPYAALAAARAVMQAADGHIVVPTEDMSDDASMGEPGPTDLN